MEELDNKNLNRIMLGEIVKVIIDRPLGSRHPQYKDLIYESNYGYIPHALAIDGEEQDAYVLGIKEPITKFEGKVIAIINRKNDIENKLVVSNKKFTKEEILKAVHFQEKYLDIEILMESNR